ncbi:MAG: TIGR04149 family rSAM-modified RiPP [Prevotella sp.]|mgnify:FL=1
MKKIKLEKVNEIGEVLSKKELKCIFGGDGSGNSSSPSSPRTSCSTTCPPESGMEGIAIECSGPCKAVDNEYVMCIGTDGFATCKKV